MTIHIKPLKGRHNLYAINGKLCRVCTGANDKPVSLLFSEKTTNQEREFFKKYLEILDII